MVTRFVPGGYKPEHAGESTAVRVGAAQAKRFGKPPELIRRARELSRQPAPRGGG